MTFHFSPGFLVQNLQEAQLGILQLLEWHFGFIAKTQLIFQGGKSGELIDHRFYILALNLEFHGFSVSMS